MPERLVVGSGPIQFTTRTGQQYLLPLPALYFDTTGTLQPDRWAAYAKLGADQDVLKTFLKGLITQGMLAPADVPAPVPAVAFKAIDPGVTGNSIRVKIANVVPFNGPPPDPAKATFDLTVTESAVYPVVSVDPAADTFITKLLGTDTAPLAKPGLVHLKAPVPANVLLPKAGKYTLAGGPPRIFAVPQDADATSTAFTLEARDNLTGPTIEVVIGAVDAGKKTFSLTVNRSASKNVKLDDLLKNNQGFEHAVEASAPKSGLGVPSAGTFSLAGGADVNAAVKAQTTIPTN
jgi:hypothetical protein